MQRCSLLVSVFSLLVLTSHTFAAVEALPAYTASPTERITQPALEQLFGPQPLQPVKGLYYPNPAGEPYATMEGVLSAVLTTRSVPVVESVRNTACAEHILTTVECRTYTAGKPVTYGQLSLWWRRAQGYDRTDENAVATPPSTAPAATYLESLRRRRPTANPQPLRAVQPSPEEIETIIEDTHREWNANSAGLRDLGNIDTTLPDLDVLQEAYEMVLYEYYKSNEITDDIKAKMMAGAVRGMVEALEDDYTTFMPAEKAKSFRQEVLNGDFQGIGAYLFNDAGILRIVEPIEGSPAATAGLQSGDTIIAVNGEPVEGETLEWVVDRIKGPAETSVTLTIERDGEEHDIAVTRAKIEVPTVTVKYTQDGTPVVRLHTFNAHTAERFIALLREEVLPKSPRAIILDLRNNTGGTLDAAYDVAAAFIPRGQEAVVMRLLTQQGEAPRQVIGTGVLSSFTGEILVLQNKYTASASEVVIGMLRDRGLVTILGEQSFGKGSAQRTHTLSDGGMLKVTFTLWASPDGHPINKVGITPDITVESQSYDQTQGVDADPLVQRAVQYLVTGA
ncbi:S41 family peptidase [Candidatus Peribacteria bacterium]|nr:S41 family peptidase [Candidatus Peribacteria bacterium]